MKQSLLAGLAAAALFMGCNTPDMGLSSSGERTSKRMVLETSTNSVGKISWKSYEKQISGKDRYRADVTYRDGEKRTVFLHHMGGAVVPCQLLYYADQVVYAEDGFQHWVKLNKDLRLVEYSYNPPRDSGKDVWKETRPQYVLLIRVTQRDYERHQYLEVWQRNEKGILQPPLLAAGQTIENYVHDPPAGGVTDELSWAKFLVEHDFLNATNQVSTNSLPRLIDR